MINRNNCMWGRSCWFDILCQKQRDNPQPLLGNAIGEIPLRDAEATSSRYPSEIPLLIFGIKGLSKDRAWESGDAALIVLLCYKGQKFRHNLGHLHQDTVILPFMSFVPQQCQDMPAARLKRKKGQPPCGFTCTQPELVSCTCSGAGLYEILAPEWFIYGNWDTSSSVSISEIYK